MKEMNLIGREEEKVVLAELFKSTDAEFLALYGRRRVGKTYLVREFFSRKGTYLEVTGIKDAPRGVQLAHFSQVFSETFFGGVRLAVPNSWEEAFEELTNELKKRGRSQKTILFLDELPWMASRKSGLIQALGYFWNRHWSSMPNFILVVCGSAASWMLENLIHAKGGLYNRVTKRILLKPFSLKETAAFLQHRSIRLKHKQILDLYMAVGGIPFYLKEVKKGKSAHQMLDALCFKESGLLFSEFENLFKSLFDQHELNLEIVRHIAQSNNSVSREELIKQLKLTSGGSLNRRLDELEASNFIKCFIPYGKKKRERFYRIVDEYTLFYIKWIEPLKQIFSPTEQGGYWQNVPEGMRLNWAGYAFESVVLKHVHAVQRKLGIDKISCKIGKWHYIPKKGIDEKGAQIDLLFDRDDGAINICEIKYRDKPFTIDKAYGRDLLQKIEVFEKRFPSEKQHFLSMITTMGIKPNTWSGLVDHEVLLDDLFV